MRKVDVKLTAIEWTGTGTGWPSFTYSSPVSIQTQSLALRALRERKPQETQALTLASSQSWLPLLRPNIPIGWRLCLLRENFTQQTQLIITILFLILILL